MFNLMSGKLNLKPNEIKSVKLPKGKYKKAPIIQITSVKGNNCFLLEKVTKNYFIVSVAQPLNSMRIEPPDSVAFLCILQIGFF